jgi:protein-S-isoprenylcysteine O-methyltransferase Ste14
MVVVAFGVTYVIGRRLFIGVMREADAERRALGRGSLYDPFLVDYGHLVFAGCVVVSLLESAHGSTSLPAWLRDVGAYTFVGWCALLLWVDAKLARFFRAPALGALLTDGPYALVRHPRYLCWMGLLVTVALVAGSLGGLIAATGFLALVVRRIVREERFLYASHGRRYAAYAASTARLIPWVY